MTEKIGLIAIFDTAQFNKGLNDYVKGVGEATSATEKAEKGGFSLTRALEVGVGVALEKVGELAIGAAMKLGEIGVESVNLAAEFQTSMVTLSTAASDSDMSLSDLSEITLKVGGDSKVLGASATGAADAMIELYRAGLKDNAIFGDMQGYLAGTAELGGVLKASFDLAAASELDVSQSAELGVVALSVFGSALETDAEKGQFAADALDNLVKTANASNASVPDLSEALKYAGVDANNFGMSIEDTNLALGLLSDAGIKGSMGGTTLSSVLRDLTKGTDDSTAALKAMGVSIYDVDGSTRPLIDIIGDMQGALEGKTQAEKDAYLQDIFTAQGMRGINVLLSEGTTGWNKMGTAIDGATGLQAQAAAQSATYAGQMEALDGQIETLKIQFGTALLPALTDFIGIISPIIEQYGPQLAEIFGNIGKFVGNLVTKFAEFITKSGGISGIWDKIVIAFSNNQFIQDIIDKFSEFSTNITPFIEETVAKAIDFWQSLQDNAAGIWEGIKRIIQGGIDFVLGIIQTGLAIYSGDWDLAWEGIKQALSGVWETIQGILETAWNVILTIFQTNKEEVGAKASEIWESVKTKTTEVWEGIKTFFSEIWESIKTNFNTAIETITTFLSEKWESIRTTVTDVWNSITEFINGIWEGIKTVFTIALGFILALVTGDTESAKAIITAVWESIKTFLSETWENLKTWASETWENIKTTVSEKFEAIKTSATEKWEAIKTTIKEKVEALKTSVPQLFEDIKTAITTKLDSLKTSISTAWENIKTTFTTKIEEIKTYLSGIDLASIGSNIIQGLANGISSAAGAIGDALSRAVDGAIAAAKAKLGIQSPSKVFAEIGVNTMLGMSQGINAASGIPQNSMQSAIGGLMSSPITTNNTSIDNSRNVNLQINNTNGNNGNRTYFDVVAGLQAVGI